MKHHLTYPAIRCLVSGIAKLLDAALSAARGMRFLIAAVLGYGCTAARVIAPAFLFFYFTGRKMKTWLYAMARTAPERRWYAFGHRYLVHGLVVILVLFASIPALRAADSPSSPFGEEILLNTLVGNHEEFIVDDLMPISLSELDSYLEAQFQNQQPPGNNQASVLPLTLYGDALLKQELPGTTVPPTREEVIAYTVEPGDTVWGIAERFGVSVATVLWENNLNLYSTIQPQQIMRILPVSGVSHTVRKGDMLKSIAGRYGASENDIQTLNSIEDATALAVGSLLIIPGGRPYSPPQPRPVVRRAVVVPPSFQVAPSGELAWPAPQSRRITQYFRWRHAGLDIGDKAGNPVIAAQSGVVEYAGWGAGGWGNTVVVDHGGGLKTRYAHASEVLVERGQKISKGETIALVGSTGRSTGPHLHLGVYMNGRAVNPLEYLR